MKSKQLLNRILEYTLGPKLSGMDAPQVAAMFPNMINGPGGDEDEVFDKMIEHIEFGDLGETPDDELEEEDIYDEPEEEEKYPRPSLHSMDDISLAANACARCAQMAMLQRFAKEAMAGPGDTVIGGVDNLGTGNWEVTKQLFSKVLQSRLPAWVLEKESSVHSEYQCLLWQGVRGCFDDEPEYYFTRSRYLHAEVYSVWAVLIALSIMQCLGQSSPH